MLFRIKNWILTYMKSSFQFFLHPLLIIAPLTASADGLQNPAESLEELRSAVYATPPSPQCTESYSIDREHAFSDFKVSQIKLNDYEWNGEHWQHILLLFIPHKISIEQTRQIVLFASDEPWANQDEDPMIAGIRNFFEKGDIFLKLLVGPFVQAVPIPIAILKQVPYQGKGFPNWDQRMETSLKDFHRTGNLQSHVLIPMIRSILRALDTLDEIFKQHKELKYILGGGSKAAWAAWLAAAADRKQRTSGLISIGYNALHFGEHLKLQKRIWGSLSEKMKPYSSIARALEGDEYKAAAERLLHKLDAYEYLPLLNIPKLMIHGANDPYFPIQSEALYLDRLGPSDHRIYIPALGHNGANSKRELIFFSPLF